MVIPVVWCIFFTWSHAYFVINMKFHILPACPEMSDNWPKTCLVVSVYLGMIEVLFWGLWTSVCIIGFIYWCVFEKNTNLKGYIFIKLLKRLGVFSYRTYHVLNECGYCLISLNEWCLRTAWLSGWLDMMFFSNQTLSWCIICRSCWIV